MNADTITITGLGEMTREAAERAGLLPSQRRARLAALAAHAKRVGDKAHENAATVALNRLRGIK